MLPYSVLFYYFSKVVISLFYKKPAKLLYFFDMYKRKANFVLKMQMKALCDEGAKMLNVKKKLPKNSGNLF